jgi:transcriptional regulator with GAF, ATPase, and Fis domain
MEQRLPVSFVELLFEELDPEHFQTKFLDALMRTQDVERGSIWIKEGDRYVCSEAAGPEADKIRGMAISAGTKSIVGSVFETGKMTVAEAGTDPRHLRQIEDTLDIRNTLILCFPLTLRDGTVFGAVQVLDTSSGGSRINLDPEYLELLEGLVTIGGLALSTSLDIADQENENVELRKILNEIRSSPPLIGQAETFLNVMRTAEVYAANDFPVMITGESGTGKELIAREIHHLSSRRDRPFLAQNCSAIPDNLLESELFGYKKGAFTGADQDKIGLFEAADGGSVFLDEIGDMPLGLQAKILRALQSSEVKPLGTSETRKVDVRVIAATNRNLKTSVEEGSFREDLFYRLNVLPLELPPLRSRPEDIPLLLTHFLERYSTASKTFVKGLAPEAVERLMEYPWPGNIREMENLVKYLLTVSQGKTVSLTDLPHPYDRPHQGELTLSERGFEGPGSSASTDDSKNLFDYSWEGLERAYVMSLLERMKWNIAAAARHAGVKRTTFASRMKKLGISKS